MSQSLEDLMTRQKLIAKGLNDCNIRTDPNEKISTKRLRFSDNESEPLRPMSDLKKATN